MEMFVEEGVKSVRMDDLAQRLGMSKRTLYEMFGSKENLLYEAMILFRKELDRCHAEIGRSAENVLEGIFLVLEHLMKISHETRTMTSNLQRFYPEVWERLSALDDAEHRSKLRWQLEQGMAEGFFRDDVNIELAISILYATATALIGRSGIVIPEGMSDQEAFIQTLSCFFRGLSTPKGVELINTYLQRYRLE